MNLNGWFKNNGSTVLTCVAAIGVTATAIFAAKAAPEANKRRERAQKKKGETLTVPELMKVEAPAYIPAAVLGAGTLICLFGANALNRRQQAALVSACAALESAYRGYREKVKGILGPETDGMIERAVDQQKKDIEGDRPPWDEVQTFYIEGCGKPGFFERTMEQVMRAEYHLNRNFILRGSATINEFLEFLDLEPVPEGETLGWDEYVGETVYGYRWIDFNHRYFTTDDGLTVCAIEMPFPPHSPDENDEETDIFAQSLPAKKAATVMGI